MLKELYSWIIDDSEDDDLEKESPLWSDIANELNRMNSSRKVELSNGDDLNFSYSEGIGIEMEFYNACIHYKPDTFPSEEAVRRFKLFFEDNFAELLSLEWSPVMGYNNIDVETINRYLHNKT
ncbi:hypothetical protein [Rubritalea tangerina]|uniref:Uncharacterized protein n=1 Tax=Rubritalea tangerina TaxID=430798 RepID=A0ABW4Z8R2_9BACT